MNAPIVLISMLAAMLAWLVGYTLAPLGFDDGYFICDAIAKLSITFALYRLFDKHYIYARFVAGVLMVSALSNLIDELFFDPCTFSFNEYVFVLIIAIYTSYTYATERSRHHK